MLQIVAPLLSQLMTPGRVKAKALGYDTFRVEASLTIVTFDCHNMFIGRYNTQHNDIQHTDPQHNWLICDT